MRSKKYYLSFGLLCLLVFVGLGIKPQHALGAGTSLAKPEITSISFVDVGDFTIKSNKNSKADGYQIRYSRSSSFENAKSVSVAGKTLKKTVTGLTPGKTYYIKIRAYKKVDGKKSYSKYSDVKSYKIKTSYTAYVTKITTTVHTEATNDSKKKTLEYMDKVTLYKNVKEYSSGVWKKLKYKDKVYYTWIDAGDQKFTKTKNPYEYVEDGLTKFQKGVIKEAVSIFKAGNTEYAHNQSDGTLNANGKYGFSCSGFAAYVVNKVMQKYAPIYRLNAEIEAFGTPGVILNPGYASEYSSKEVCGKKLDLSLLKPGDIVFFNHPGGDQHPFPWNHCGIYLGKGDFAHCSGSFNEVRIMPLEGFFKRDFAKAIRVLPKKVTPINEERVLVQNLSVYSSPTCHSEELIARIGKGESVTLLWTTAKNGYVCYGPDQYGFVFKPEEKLAKKE